MKLAHIRTALGALALSLAPATAFAQEGPPPFEFEQGPVTGELGKARIQVPEGLAFVDRANTRKLLEVTQNIPGGREVGAVIGEDWFVVFTYEDSGHVKDEDKDDLDAEDLLETLEDGVDAGNDERKRRGWATFELAGWHKPPFYDPKTNNLTWATIIRAEGEDSINWSTRLLGRTGTMHVELVASPQSIRTIMPDFEELMSGFEYVEGQRYAEFRSGDRVAEYGLAALVAGGAGVVAAKTGLLAKFWKVLIIPFLALAALFKKLFGFGKSEAGGPA